MFHTLKTEDGSAQLSVTPKFSLGQVVATPGVLAALEEHGVSPLDLLARHVRGDWGSVPVEDAQLNDEALHCGGRLLSSYPIGPNTRAWLLSEADRSVTTLLLPEEY